MTETILEEAQRLVYGPRQQSYGHPADDFARTGRLWGAILGIDDVRPDLVGLCLAAVKISREVNAPKRDNLVDLAGYAGAVSLIREREATPGPARAIGFKPWDHITPCSIANCKWCA